MAKKKKAAKKSSKKKAAKKSPKKKASKAKKPAAEPTPSIPMPLPASPSG